MSDKEPCDLCGFKEFTGNLQFKRINNRDYFICISCEGKYTDEELAEKLEKFEEGIKKNLKGDLEIHIKWGPVNLQKKIKNVNDIDLMPKIDELTKRFNAELEVENKSISHVANQLILKIKYMGIWLIQCKKENVPIRNFGIEVYNMSQLIQRTNDQLHQGTQTPKNVTRVRGQKEFGDV